MNLRTIKSLINKFDSQQINKAIRQLHEDGEICRPAAAKLAIKLINSINRKSDIRNFCWDCLKPNIEADYEWQHLGCANSNFDYAVTNNEYFWKNIEITLITVINNINKYALPDWQSMLQTKHIRVRAKEYAKV